MLHIIILLNLFFKAYIYNIEYIYKHIYDRI